MTPNGVDFSFVLPHVQYACTVASGCARSWQALLCMHTCHANASTDMHELHAVDLVNMTVVLNAAHQVAIAKVLQ